MQLGNQNMQYDRAKTIFSPDGRLFQVEYAREAVKKGSTSIGMIYDNGVLLMATRKTNKLQARNPEKVFKIDEHLGVSTSGLVADGRVLVDDARQEAQKKRMTYGEPITIQSQAKFLADIKQRFTQYGGVRPFGLAMLTGGINKGKPELYQSDPSGILKEWKAVAIGKGSEKAMEIFQEEYNPEISEQEAIDLSIKVLKEIDEDLETANIELCLINEEEKFHRISTEQLEEKGVDL